MRRKMPSKYDKSLHEAYRRVYAISEPVGDWDKIYADSPVHERGYKIVPFMDYICDGKEADRIFYEVCKEFKIRGSNRESLKIHFYLGYSPLFHEE
jgi:hypothetical protein